MSYTMKALNVAMVLTLALNTTSCTEEEVAAAIGGAAIVAGAIVIANNTQCVSGYREVCNDYYTYRGRRVVECREVYDSCLYTTFGALGLNANGGISEAVVTNVNWSTTFKAGFDGSGKFVSALKQARDEKKLDGLKALGLDKGAVKKIAKGELPSEKSIDALAKSLDQNVEATREMLNTLIAKNQEISSQK